MKNFNFRRLHIAIGFDKEGWFVKDNKGYKNYELFSLVQVRSNIENENLNTYRLILGPIAIMFGLQPKN